MSDLNNAEIPSAGPGQGDGGDYQQRVDPTPANGRSASSLKPSSRSNPCPICGRTKDGDCRLSPKGWLCHITGSTHPSAGLVKGKSTIKGTDGQTWAFTGITEDARCAMFKPDEPILQSAERASVVRERSWDYTNREGTPLIRVHRKDLSDGTKQIRQEPLVAGLMPRDLLSQVTPYRWKEADQALADGAPWVIWAEGEPCVDALWDLGLPAVTSIGGSKAFRLERDGGLLPADRVVIAPDRDKTGVEYGLKVAKAHPGCHWLLAEPTSSKWNGSIPPDDGFDIADWIKQGATPEQVLQAITDQPPAAAGSVEASTPAGEGEEERPATFSELTAWTLDAVTSGDIDAEMLHRADLKIRFRATDQQIERHLIELHISRKIKAVPQRGEGVDLSLVRPLTYRTPGWSVRGDCQITYGPYSTGKTTLALAKAMALATGSPFLDREEPCEPGNSLIIATDSGAAALKKALADLGIDPDTHPAFSGPTQQIWIWAHAPEQGHSAWVCNIRGIVALESFIVRRNIAYVAIDSAKSVSSGAGWSYTDNESVKGVLRYIREGVAEPTGCTIELLSHDGTQKGTHAGAKAWAEDPSMVIALSVVEENGQQVGVQAEFRKDRAALTSPRRTVRYRLEDGALILLPCTEIVGNCSEALLTILREAHQRGANGGLSRGDLVHEAFRRFAKSRKTVDNTLNQLVSDRRVVKVRKGIYAISPAEAQRSGPPIHAKREVIWAEPMPPLGPAQFPTHFPRELVGNSVASHAVPDSSRREVAGNSLKVNHINEFAYKSSHLGEMGGVSTFGHADESAALMPGGGSSAPATGAAPLPPTASPPAMTTPDPVSPTDPAWLPLAKEMREQDPPAPYGAIQNRLFEDGFGDVKAKVIRDLLPPPEQAPERLG